MEICDKEAISYQEWKRSRRADEGEKPTTSRFSKSYYNDLEALEVEDKLSLSVDPCRDSLVELLILMIKVDNLLQGDQTQELTSVVWLSPTQEWELVSM